MSRKGIEYINDNLYFSIQSGSLMIKRKQREKLENAQRPARPAFCFISLMPGGLKQENNGSDSHVVESQSQRPISHMRFYRVILLRDFITQ